jgi:hypothetical protein
MERGEENQVVRKNVGNGASVAGTTVSANSEHEARQKFLSGHISSGTTKYKIVSVVKTE